MNQALPNISYRLYADRAKNTNEFYIGVCVYTRIKKQTKEIRKRLGIVLSDAEWDNQQKDFTTLIKNDLEQYSKLIAKINETVNELKTNLTHSLSRVAVTNSAVSIHVQKNQLLTEYLTTWNNERLANKQITTSTYSQHANWVKRIQEYQCKHQLSILVSDFNKQLARALGEYILHCKPQYSIETVKKINKALKQYSKVLYNNDLIDKLITQDPITIKRGVKTTEDAKKSFAIEDQLIQRLLAYNCVNNQEQLIKDFAVIALYSGLRFADINQLKKLKIKKLLNDGHTEACYIELITTKTKQAVAVYLHPRVVEIYQRYGNKFPEFPSNQHVNRQLKVIFETIARGEKTERTYKIYGHLDGISAHKAPINKLISCHILRKTFFTSLIKIGIRDELIAKLVGHSYNGNRMATHYNYASPKDYAKMMYHEIKKIDIVNNPNSIWKI